MALVQSSEAQKVRRGPGCGNGALCAPRQRGGIVGPHFEVGLPDVDGMGEDVRVGDGSSELQIRVRNVAVGILP